MMAAVTGVKAQVLSNQDVVTGVTGENAFLDASTSFVDNNSLGKGLVFPQADLTTWVFNTASLDGIVFPTAFDGMIVYNTATGTTVPGQGEEVPVEPGFYYFSNPDGIFTLTIDGGAWKKIGGLTATSVKPVHMEPGDPGQILKTNGMGTAVEWVNPDAISVKTGAYTATINDRTIVYNLSAPATLTLPAASTVPGKVYIIRRVDDTDNVLTFSQAINFGGGVTATTMKMPATLMVQSDGTTWYSIN